MKIGNAGKENNVNCVSFRVRSIHPVPIYYLNRTIPICAETQAAGKSATVKMLTIPQRVYLRFFHVSFSQHLSPQHQEESSDLDININNF
jgi:hypothetical protein